MVRSQKGDKLFDLINTFLLCVVTFIVLYPLYFVVIASISDPDLVNTGKVFFVPKGITFMGYVRVFQDKEILIGYRNTIFYTIFGTLINVTLTLTSAYALSKKRLRGRNFFTFLFAFTMYFSGGLIPTYLLVKSLGMLNTIWALVIPNAVSMYNIVVARTFFSNSVPSEIEESAFIDGCNISYTFVKIIIPLSKALISVLALNYGVGHWNAFFDALIYVTNRNLYPLQLILREILIQNQMKTEMMQVMAEGDDMVIMQMKIASMIKYAVIIVSSIPVLVVYPFIQKYFTQGIMIGALKG